MYSFEFLLFTFYFYLGVAFGRAAAAIFLARCIYAPSGDRGARQKG